MQFGPTAQLVAQILLIANVIVFILIEWVVIRKALKLPIPDGYPPKDWDWFQRWVEKQVILVGTADLFGRQLCDRLVPLHMTEKGKEVHRYANC